MSTDSGPVAKRFRPSSLGSNIQLTECIREFKLPQQFPSMAPKLHNSSKSTDKTKSQILTSNVSILPKVSISSKILQSKEAPLTNMARTVKLRAKDGRDLGEVKIRDLTQNRQGETNKSLTENAIKKVPEVLSVIDKTKGITIGVLTPVKLVSPDYFAPQETERNANLMANKSVLKDAPPLSESPKVSVGAEAPARPQVLVIQSGKNFHMAKIPNAALTDLTKKSTSNCAPVKSQPIVNCGKVTISGLRSPDSYNRNDTSGGNTNDVTEAFIIPGKNIYPESNAGPITTNKRIQPKAPDNIIEICKPKSLLVTDNGETIRPKIQISRIVAYGNKSLTIVPNSRNPISNSNPVRPNDTVPQKNPHLRQDVMVILPHERAAYDTDIDSNPSNKIESMKNLDSPEKSLLHLSTNSNTETTNTKAHRKKLLVNKISPGTKSLSTMDVTSSPRQEKKDDMENNLIILEKALSSVEDEVLRKKALKALAECGIGMERFVPSRPALEQRSIKDSDTQTSIFGLWDDNNFIHVPENLPILERIAITEKQTNLNNQTPNATFTNPNSQDLFMNGAEWPRRLNKECIELTHMVEGFVRGNDTANEVAAIFDKPCPVRAPIVQQLQNDFDNCKKYDKDGLLNIHKAVVMQQIQAVARHLMVLQACRENPDIPTRDGRTSLELAISHDVSPEIVKILLEVGAEPTSMDTGHDSALIIASKKSSPLLLELIRYVKSSKSLNHYDSTGIAALHYCAQNGYQDGAIALINASADINLQDRRSGRTALFHAIENEHNDLAEMLLAKGAEPTIANYGGQTIFHILDDIKHFNLLGILNEAAK